MNKRQYCESRESIAYYSGLNGLEIKEHWTDIYRNAIFLESFRNAERMLAVIADLESEG